MFDIGFGEMLLLAVIALIAIGPKQLPEVARVAGRMLNELKRATGEFTRTFTDVSDTANRAGTDLQNSLRQKFDQSIGQSIGQTRSHLANTINDVKSSLTDVEKSVGEISHPAHDTQMSLGAQAPLSVAPVAMDEHQQMSFELTTIEKKKES